MGITALKALAVCTAVLVVGTGGDASSAPQRPQFRASVRLVPLEVHAVGRDGVPITDLTADDFTVREDGHLQQIAHFERISVDAGQPTKGRTFLIALGAGRLSEPARALEALIRFVRTQLMPADLVGLVVWLRHLEPTTNHEAVARLLERFRDRHERVESLIRRDMERDRRRAGRPGIVSAETSAAIDALLHDGALRISTLPGLEGGGGYQILSDHRALRHALLLARATPGDEHVLIVTERIVPLGPQPRDLLESYWVKLAVAGRATLSFIHAGGLGATRIGTGMSRGRLAPRSSVAGFWQAAAIADQRRIAELTGGVASFFEFVREPLSAIDGMTRSLYQLGYYPALPPSPGQLRRIEVAVRRPGVRLVYRRGHVDAAPADTIEDVRRVVTDAMIALGAEWSSSAPPFDEAIPRYVRLEIVRRTSAESPLPVTVSFDPRWLAFVETPRGFVSDVELALFVDSGTREIVGERRLRLKLELTAADYARTDREWLTYETTIPVTADPRRVRAVLYDFEMDRLATAQARVPR